MSCEHIRSYDVRTKDLKTGIWSAKDLAAYLGVSMSWIYKNTQREAEDPIPRCPGMKRLRFNLADPEFQAWLERRVGVVV